MLVLLLIMLLSYRANAAYISTLSSGASNVVHDYFCTCKKASNASAKDIMIPHKTSPEWASFYGHPPANVTITSCLGSGNGAPTFDVPNLSPGSCKGTTTAINVANRPNNGTRAITVNIDSVSKAGFNAHCDAFVLQNEVSTVFTDGMTVNVCQNDDIKMSFACDAGTYSTTITFTDVTTATDIDSFSVTLSSASACK